MRDEPLRPVVLPKVLLEHTDGLIVAVQRYHTALAQMMAAEHTIREVVDNALRAGVSASTLRGIINSFADAQNTPLLYASDVDPRLTGEDHDLMGVDSLLQDRPWRASGAGGPGAKRPRLAEASEPAQSWTGPVAQ